MALTQVSTGMIADGAITSAKLATGTPLTAPNAINEAPPVTIASAATVAIGAAAANSITISGTTTITAFDSIAAGAVRRLVFAGALTLTHNATSLILPSGASITTAAGDVAEFVSLGSGNWRCFNYMKASGQAVVAPAAGVTSVATGNGLTGGTITSTGTLSIAAPAFDSVGAYGTGTKVNTTYTVNSSVASPSYMNVVGNGVGGTYSGTWRVMSGAVAYFSSGCNTYPQYQMVRIA
jgi:hypothetical protein